MCGFLGERRVLGERGARKVRRKVEVRGEGANHEEPPDFRCGHSIKLGVRQLSVIHVAAAGRFRLRHLPRKEFEHAVLAVVAQELKVPEGNESQPMSG